MLGFGSFASAARFCSAFEELRQYLRARGRRGGVVPPAEQRRRFVGRWHALIAENGGGVDSATVRGLHCASSVP